MVAANEQRKLHEYMTKKMNNSFHTSKPEDRTYNFLLTLYDANNIERQYRSDKYPFNCDFYIKSKDIYIECNFSWTHGGHWFDPDNKDDQEKLKKWRDKGTKYYDIAIKTWAERDVKKRQCAINEQLRYVVIWTEDYDDLKSQLDLM